MKSHIARNLKTLRVIRENITNKKLSFVPTMGSLHNGHIKLIKSAIRKSDKVIVSIFINPKQFDNREDFSSYPSNEKEDIKKLKDLGVDIIFIPQEKEIYPEDFNMQVKIGEYNKILCAAKRKNHFIGVSTILIKLFFLIRPHFTFFGEKDYQQLVIVKKLVKDFSINTTIIAVKTVRDRNGLALSSRNNLLTSTEYDKAVNINKVLREGKKYKLSSYKKLILETENSLRKLGIKKIDYLEIREEKNLRSYEQFKNQSNTKFRIFIAVYIGRVRLIDNMRIN